MPASATTQAAVRSLWELGALYSRPPAPTPEVDPWEEDEPLAHRHHATVVVFPGDPSIAVRLFEDLDDTVVIDDSVDLEVPRRDTLAVVEAILADRCRLHLAARGFWAGLAATFLHAPFGAELVVPTGTAPGAAVYRAPVTTSLPGAWISRLPVD
ncbi:MAG: hypothetical protein JWP95_175 [Actinotalea sp.]|nr:hypothetical protein [Actinotalea sp.]